MASSAQLDLLKVWLSAQNQQVIVLVFDVFALKECCNLGVPYLYHDGFKLGGGQDMQFKRDQFLKLGLAKFSVLKAIIEAGYSVLFSEIDVYELRDPEQCKVTLPPPRPWTPNQLECLYTDPGNFEVEIHPNIHPGKLAMHGSELNIGFFYI